ncbi:telomere repeats-binding bouquet formation protein 1-like isoform X2 [Anneissia japonica]|uniref:telomere repeats-binding bouquet formation protein 1-like isoform X2 n=1 Tax=Anneissia japonica TaxID=1529436 RepID=UPI001425A124|nr:telomere repeats-binding bouquet formation protein 1-like isoform X2 [Anneissia japonica]
MLNSPSRSNSRAGGSLSKKYSGIHEMKTELSLLLESLKYHINCPDAQKTALSTLSAMLLHSDDAKEMFRKCGGLLFVRTLLTSVDSEQVKVAALYTLGCALEKTTLSQKHLCEASMFQFLHSQLISDESSNQLKTLSTFLILCLVTNNSVGQMIVRESKCLNALLALFSSNKLRNSLLKPEENSWLDHINEEEGQYKLWKSITSCLCGCVNNPQNVDNQLMCASVFPAALYILEKTSNHDIMRLVLSFISMTVANNEKNQNRFADLSGLKVLVEVLHDQVKMLQMHQTSEAIRMTEHIASTVVSCIEDNEESHSLFADLHVIPLLLQTLTVDSSDTSTKLQIVLALVQCTDSCEETQRQFLACDGVTLLVQLMSEVQDEEFSKTATYLLQMCLASQKLNVLPSFKTIPETDKKRDFLQHYRHQKYNMSLAAGGYGENGQHEDTQIPITRKESPHNCSTESQGITQNIQAMVQTMVEMFQKTLNQSCIDTPKVINSGDAETSQKSIKELQKSSAITKNSSNNVVSSNQSLGDDECMMDEQPQNNCDAGNTRTSETTVDFCKTPLNDLQQLDERLKHLEETIKLGANHSPDPKIHIPGCCKQASQTENHSLIKKQPVREISTQTPTRNNIRNVKKGRGNRKKNQSDGRSSTENEKLTMDIQQAISSYVYMNSQSSDGVSKASESDIFKKPEAPGRHRKKEKAAKTSKKPMRTLYNVNSQFLMSHDDSEPESEGNSCDELESASQIGRNFKDHVQSNDDDDEDNVNCVPSEMPLTSPPVRPHNKIIDYDNCNEDNQYNESDLESVISELSMIPSVIECYRKQNRRNPVEDWLRESCTDPEKCGKQTEDTATSVKKFCRSHSKYATRKTDRSDANQTLSHSKPSIRSRRKHSTDDDLPCLARPSDATLGHHSAKRIAYKVRCGKDNEQGKSSDALVIARLFKQCPGCVPPVGLPLLNSINYTRVLKNCRHTCKEHRYIIGITEKYRQRVRKKITVTDKMTDHKEQQLTVHQSLHEKRRDGHEGVLLSRSGNMMENQRKDGPSYSFREREKQELQQTSAITENSSKSVVTFNQKSSEDDECMLDQRKENPTYNFRKRPKQKYFKSDHDEPITEKRRRRKDYTDIEIENLIIGVREKGKNWNNILWSYEFQPGRTNVDLKDKYKQMQKKRLQAY